MIFDEWRIQIAMDAEALRIDTNRVLQALTPAAVPGAINWADLTCYTAIIGVDDEGSERMEVRITEAAPDNPDLQRAVQDGLKQFGYNDVDVITVW